MEARAGAHHVHRQLQALGHNDVPAEVCEMKEEMDERSARRNHKTGLP
jgi:hypothetical protein